MGLKTVTRPESVLVGIVILALLVAGNPLGVFNGIETLEPEEEIYKEVNKISDGKILFIASFDDFYDNEVNLSRRRNNLSNNVDAAYLDILDAASLGDEYFNSFLIFHKITHVLVPLKSATLGEIQYKWGEIGSIRIRLGQPYFRKVMETSSDYSSVLYAVNKQSRSGQNLMPDPEYSFKWSKSIRSSFYQIQRTVSDDGLYDFKFGVGYENGLDVSWVYGYPQTEDGIAEKTEIAEFEFSTSSPELSVVSVELTFVAAYGGFAPPQTVRVALNGETTAYVLKVGAPVYANLKLKSGDVVRIENALPCRLPATFDPDATDWRKYCFGITDIRVRQEIKS